MRAALRRALPPDLAHEREDPDIGFVHRQMPDGELYFIANLGGETKRIPATFRSGNVQEIWDLMTGKVESGWDGTLRLDPYGSTRTGALHRNHQLEPGTPRQARPPGILA